MNRGDHREGKYRGKLRGKLPGEITGGNYRGEITGVHLLRQSIPPARLYPGLKRSRLDHTRVYYGLGQSIPHQAKLWPHDINHDISSVERYTQELYNFSTSY